MIRDNLSALKVKIASICKRVGRNPDEVTLIGVTKYSEIDQIKEAIDAGLKDIGENRVQEGQRKFPVLDAMHVKVKKHLIGHLQTNKVKNVLPLFDLIHSVESEKLADEIDKQAAKLNKPAHVLIQVSTSGEEQKFGIDPKDVDGLLQHISQLRHVRVEGLMTMAPLTEDKEVIRQCFKDLRLLRDELQKKYVGSDKIFLKYLSMGMSQDFEIALEEGANMLRIGSAIFK